MNIFSSVRKLLQGLGQGILLVAFVTILVLAAGVTTYLNTSFAGHKSHLYSYEYKKYDGTTVPGSDVIYAIEDAEFPKQNRLQITVVSGNSSAEYGWESQSDTTYEEYDSSTDVTDADWINPDGSYASELDLENKAVVGITFTLQ